MTLYLFLIDVLYFKYTLLWKLLFGLFQALEPQLIEPFSMFLYKNHMQICIYFQGCNIFWWFWAFRTGNLNYFITVCSRMESGVFLESGDRSKRQFNLQICSLFVLWRLGCMNILKPYCQPLIAYTLSFRHPYQL